MDLQQALSQLREVNYAIEEIDRKIKAGDKKRETCDQYNSFINQQMGLTGYIRMRLNEEAEEE